MYLYLIRFSNKRKKFLSNNQKRLIRMHIVLENKSIPDLKNRLSLL